MAADARPQLFDAHLHIVDPRFPLVANRGYLPEPFTVADYRREIEALPVRVIGGAVVSGSFQADDTTYLVDALDRLGEGFVGVVDLPVDASDDEIGRLDRAGVRAVRFNLYRGGREGMDRLEPLARRVHDLVGWHTELYVDGARLPELAARLVDLPRVVIDHLGMTEAGLPTLLELVTEGVHVKATGFGRVALDVPDALRRIAAVDPTALVFGTDLPSTRARRPFDAADIQLVIDTLDPATAERALARNAVELYLGER